MYKTSLKISKGYSETEDRRRTDNTMAKRQKDRQHNGQKTEGQTTQWPKEKGEEGQTTQWPKEKEQTTIYKSLHKKNPKDRLTETPTKNRW